MSIGMRAMFANTAALNVTGHNIANNGVAGYSRQEAELATAQGQFNGAGFFGKGVVVTNVKRAHDQFLTMQTAAAQSLSSMDSARAGQLSQLEDVFPPGEQGIGSATGNFLNSMVDLANTPADSSARQVVLARANDLAARYSSAASRLAMLQQGVQSDLQTSAKTVSALAEQVAKVNAEIARTHGLDQAPNDLLDKRDQLVAEIGKYVQVSTIDATDGTMGVFVAGGQRLVLGIESNKMLVMQDPADPSRSALALETPNQPLMISQDMLTGGSMAGLIRFQNKDLVDARNLLGQMAVSFATKVNTTQSLGLDLGDPPGAGAPLFAFGAPVSIANLNNARDATGNFAAQATLAVTDASLLQASDYQLKPDGSGVSGSYTLVRLSDGLTRNIADGDEVDGFTINIGSPDLAATDSLLLRPCGMGATDMRCILDDPSGIAASSPVTAVLSPANKGTATVGSLKVLNNTIDPNQTATINFSSDTGDYDWELRDKDTGALLSSGSATWTAGEPIEVNGFALSLNGVPKSGDKVTVSKTQFPATNNGNALQMFALRDEQFVGRTIKQDGSIAEGATITDAYASVMADIGVRVQSAKTSAEISGTAADSALKTLTSKTGVNLDEEAARLIQFQQGYQAAAKVLQVAQQVFDTMLQLGA
ncbi:MAG: flagellar hook-associated protein FlgK [Burkholderiales bacterium PBB6]|nr:MAG: flagellar hook-associated protein FlgK [Burkholderiales bacterium PBB6]